MMMRYLLLILLLMIIGNVAIEAQAAVGKEDIAVDADQLEVIQNENKAIFTGKVVAKQGEMTLRSDKMIIYYAKKEQQQANSPMGALEKIEVIGDVHMTTKTESADGERGVYDAIREKIFLYGNVVLRKENNVLTGEALQYDMVTGSSILTGGGGVAAEVKGGKVKPKRVQGVFVPKSDE
jgi:lipopolysaccharide export system protein LptA